MKHLTQGIQRFLREDEGVTMVEYGLIASLVSIIAIAALSAVGTELSTLYTLIQTCLTGAACAP